MEMMKAKVFLSSTGDVHLRHKVIQVITKSGAYELGQVRLYVFIPLPHFFLEQFRARRIVIMETINAQSTKRTVGSFEAFCLFIHLLFFVLSLLKLLFPLFIFACQFWKACPIYLQSRLEAPLPPHFLVHIICLPHPHFMDLSLHPHFPVHLEF
jgi:hypothetical protein